jgi:hypothetical protein
VLRYVLPDGRTVLVERLANDLHWHLQLEGEPTTELVGAPLQSALAELLGYAVARQSWPSWLDDCAAEIERLLW